MTRNEDVRKSLRRIESDDPVDIRSAVVRSLLDHSAADFAFFFRYSERDGQLFHCAATVVGDGEAGRRLRGLEGSPSVNSPCWSPWRPRPIEKQRFVGLANGPVSIEQLSKSEGHRLIYVPMGIKDHARILLYDGRRFLGWLGLMRSKEASFGRRELAELNRLVPTISASLSAAEDLENDPATQGLYLIVDPHTRRVEWASRAARPWLNRRRVERLETLLSGFRRGEDLSTAYLDGHEVRVIELVGERGIRFHVHVTPAGSPRVGPVALLSRRQREVAGYAAAGATTGEIAKAMGLSVYTVADHMKATYARLGVSNRVELASCLSDASR